MRAPIGTLLSQLCAFAGGITDDATRIIAGGPMMGRALPRLDLPLIKGMNGLLLLTGKAPFEEGFGPCIQCGRCLEACPLGLEPDQARSASRPASRSRPSPSARSTATSAAACTYVCPAGRPLLQFMQVAKSSLRRARECEGDVVSAERHVRHRARARTSTPRRRRRASCGGSTGRWRPAALWGVFVFGWPALRVIARLDRRRACCAEAAVQRALRPLDADGARRQRVSAPGCCSRMTLPPLVAPWMAFARRARSRSCSAR